MVSGLASRALFVVSVISVLVFIARANRCIKPAVRREWRALSSCERQAWLDAVKCLSHLPHNDSLTPTVDSSFSRIPPINSSSSLYDDFVYVHMDLNELIHFTGFFLPWHRLYVHAFETTIKEKCGYSGTQPYWDWTIDAPDFYHSTMFDPSHRSGLGGWGDPNNDFQITDGAFSTDFVLSYPVPHRVRRNFTLQPFLGLNFNRFEDGSTSIHWDPQMQMNTSFTRESQVKMVNGYIGDFLGFQSFMEGNNGSHPAIHLMVGADLTGTCPFNAPTNCVGGPKWSPNDPLFFLHHSMIDKLWYDWQHAHKNNFWSFHGGSVGGFTSVSIYAKYPNGAPPFLNFTSVLPSDGILPELEIHDLMDTMGGTLCYVYE